MIMSLFASLIAPFGGFFASGIKRAIKIKDFGDVIPGHGGLIDRFDCQLIMVYISKTIKKIIYEFAIDKSYLFFTFYKFLIQIPIIF